MRITNNNINQYFSINNQTNYQHKPKENKDRVETQNTSSLVKNPQVESIKKAILSVTKSPQKINHALSTDRALYLLSSKVNPSERLSNIKIGVLSDITAENNRKALLSKDYNMNQLINFNLIKK